MHSDPSRTAINPVALRPAELAELLSRVGGQAVSEGLIHEDLLAGAPANADGTLNLVHYAAWLLKEMGRAADGD